MRVPGETSKVQSTCQVLETCGLRFAEPAAARAQFVLEVMYIEIPETRMHTDDTIRVLNRLIRVCRDGEDFCGAAARGAEAAELGVVLRHRGEEWGRLGDELQALVLLLGGEPATSATFAARVRHWGLGARLAVLGPADATIIAAWQGIERQAEAGYLAAIEGYLPERIRRTVSLQADRVVGRAERIGDLLGNVALHSPGH
jgi:uncharacterized protein (TIGR02284 family)